MLSTILDTYIRNLIVNTHADKQPDWGTLTDHEEVLDRFYGEQDETHEGSELESQFLQEILDEGKGESND